MGNCDMLVKLYALDEARKIDERVARAGIRIHRPMPGDASRVLAYVRETFSEAWACECQKALCSAPATCLIAVNARREIVGFCCYDATCRGFFGPIGVSPSCRGQHVGQELLRCALYAMREAGYGYAIIGWCAEHNVPFYEKACGAIAIPDSFPGVYRDALDV